MSRNHVLILVIVGCLIAAAAVFFRPGGGTSHGENNANFPDGTFWICDNPQCGEQFTLTMKQLDEHHAKHYGEPLPCPKCGKTHVSRAMVDAATGKWVRLTRGGPVTE
jgi:hypothetical protein